MIRGPPAMISGRCDGSIRQASAISRSHSSEWMCMLDTMKMSGIRPSSRICAGLKFRFHCSRTMRVFLKPESTSAEPIACTPAGTIFMSA